MNENAPLLPSEDSPELRRVFLEASKIPSKEKRDRYLRETCKDLKLREFLESLLATSQPNDPEILSSAIDVAQTFRERSSPNSEENNESHEEFKSDPSRVLDSDLLLGVLTSPVPSGLVSTNCGAYRIGRLLGEGGMGVVFEAEQFQPLCRRVAIKFLNFSPQSEEAARRFEQEKQTLARLKHPNIARIYDAGSTELGQSFLAMELVEGTRLDEHTVAECKDLGDVLELFISVCNGVAYTHAQRVVHLDLKPSNVIVERIDGEAVPRIIDFGAAALLDAVNGFASTTTGENDLVATPLYMSPEVAGGRPNSIDHRADIYSLGVMLYKLVTGENLISIPSGEKNDWKKIRHTISNSPVQPPNRRVCSRLPWSRIPKPIENIVLRCVERLPQNRYSSVAALVVDLRQQLGILQMASEKSERSLSGFSSKPLLATFASVAALLTFACTASLLGLGAADRSRSEPPASSQTIGPIDAVSSLAYSASLRELVEFLEDGNLVDAKRIAVSLASAPPAARKQINWSTEILNAAAPSPEHEFPHESAVHCFAVSNQNRQVFTASDAGQIRRFGWKAASDTPEIVGSHDFPAQALALSPDGRFLASGDREGFIKIWDLETGSQSTSGPRRTGIETLKWSPDNQRLAAGVRYSQVEVLDRRSKAIAILTTGGRGRRFESLLFHRGSTHLIISHQDSGVEEWDITERIATSRISVDGFDGPVRAMVQLTQSNCLLLSDKSSPYLWLVSAADPNLRRVVKVGRTYAKSMAVSPNGNFVACAHGAGSVTLLEVGPEQSETLPEIRLRCVFEAHVTPEQTASHVEFADDETLVTSGGDGFVRVWKLANLLPLDATELSQSIRAGFATNGDLWAISPCSDDYRVRITSQETVSQSTCSFRLPSKVVEAVQASDPMRLDRVSQLIESPSSDSTNKPSHFALATLVGGRLTISSSNGNSIELPATSTPQSASNSGKCLSWDTNTLQIAEIGDRRSRIWKCNATLGDWQLVGEWEADLELFAPAFYRAGILVAALDKQTGSHAIQYRRLVDGELLWNISVPELIDFCVIPESNSLAVAQRASVAVWGLTEEGPEKRSSHALAASPTRIHTVDSDHFAISSTVSDATIWSVSRTAPVGTFHFDRHLESTVLGNTVLLDCTANSLLFGNGDGAIFHLRMSPFCE